MVCNVTTFPPVKTLKKSPFISVTPQSGTIESRVEVGLLWIGMSQHTSVLDPVFVVAVMIVLPEGSITGLKATTSIVGMKGGVGAGEGVGDGEGVGPGATIVTLVVSFNSPRSQS